MRIKYLFALVRYRVVHLLRGEVNDMIVWTSLNGLLYGAFHGACLVPFACIFWPQGAHPPVAARAGELKKKRGRRKEEAAGTMQLEHAM